MFVNRSDTLADVSAKKPQMHFFESHRYAHNAIPSCLFLSAGQIYMFGNKTGIVRIENLVSEYFRCWSTSILPPLTKQLSTEPFQSKGFKHGERMSATYFLNDKMGNE